MSQPREDETARATSWQAPWAQPQPASWPAQPATADGRALPATGELPEQPPSWRGRLHRQVEQVSLRVRLLAILVLALLAALAVTGYGVQAAISKALIGQVDDQLQATYQHAMNDRFFLQGTLQIDRQGPPTAFTAFLSVDGHPELNRSNTYRTDKPQPEFSAVTSGQATAWAGRTFTVPGPHGHDWRAVAVPVTYTVNETSYPASVVLTLPLDDIEAAVGYLRTLTMTIGGMVIVLVAALGWVAIRRAFRPLLEVEETAAAIAAGDLSRRIPERPASTEVGRLTRSLNGMLTQIESAFRAREASEARTRRFAADASHELRTPLVSIRGFAELYRQGAVPPEEVPRTMRRIEDEAKRMGSLVEDLLLLARLDEQRPGRKDPVDLAVLAGDAVHDARGLDPDRRVTLVGLHRAGPEPAVVTGDEDRLRQVVANLVANAVRHTPPGTAVEVAVGQARGPSGAPTAVLEVRDHGQGLTPEQAQRVFERFYRVDSSRQRATGGGSGLGLSIVAAVVAAHSGTVEVHDTPGGGATFRVVLPARTTQEASLSASQAPGAIAR